MNLNPTLISTKSFYLSKIKCFAFSLTKQKPTVILSLLPRTSKFQHLHHVASINGGALSIHLHTTVAPPIQPSAVSDRLSAVKSESASWLCFRLDLFEAPPSFWRVSSFQIRRLVVISGGSVWDDSCGGGSGGGCCSSCGFVWPPTSLRWSTFCFSGCSLFCVLLCVCMQVRLLLRAGSLTSSLFFLLVVRRDLFSVPTVLLLVAYFLCAFCVVGVSWLVTGCVVGRRGYKLVEIC